MFISFIGLCKDEKTLREVGVMKGVKVMVVGSTLDAIIAVNTPTEQDVKEEKAAGIVNFTEILFCFFLSKKGY